jgi:TolB-like protein/Flp pilus assembly protein TadD/predicted Ser/Thr protein kinase
VKPGALTDLLRRVAASPEEREAEPTPLLPGAVVGRFEVVRELGRGAFGVVYEARDRELGRQVALKMVRPGAAAVEDRKVSREAEAIARLSHPNLVTLHDVGRSEAGPYLVFELLRGKTLQERIDDGPMPAQEAVHIAVEVARGLAHAHAEGVVHRDLKPANVFVTTKGQVKILDFGMAHAFGRRRLSGGTPAYMAPEQWEDEPEDERTDVFALGVMLYRMLSGEYPFPEGEGRWSAGEATAPELDVAGAPGLAGLVDRMLEKAPKGRPRDGAAVLAALTPIEDALRAKPADGSAPAHATRRKATLGDLIAELRRRRVFRALLGYGIFAFAMLQVVEPVMHGLDLPGWVLRVVVVALGAGLPLTILLSWAYDLKRTGIVRAAPASDREGMPRRSPWRLAGLVSAGAVLGAGLSWLAQRQVSPPVPAAGPDGRITVAVADFVNDTRDGDLEGLSVQLITSLEQSQRLRVLTRSRMVDVLREMGKPNVPVVDEVLGRQVSLAAGVRALVVASIRRFDDLYAIDLKVLDPSTSEYFFTLKEERSGKAAIPGMIDRLSEKARERLRETPAQVSASRVNVAEATTRSYQAWQHYFEGTKLEDALRYEGAITQYRKAVEVDGHFALAWYRIAYLGEFAWWTALEERQEAMAAAIREIDRVPVKERMLFQAWKAHMERRPEEAHALYGQAAEAFPQDKEVLYLAGYLYFHERRFAEALAWFAKALALDPAYPEALVHVVAALSRLGRGEEAVTTARDWVEKAPGTRSRVALAQALVSVGRSEEGIEVARRMVAEDPGMTRALAFVLILAEHFDEAEELLRPLAKPGAPNRAASAAELLLALTYQGRIREALEVVDQHAGLPGVPPWWELGMGWNVLAAGRNTTAALPKALALDEADLRRGETADQFAYWYLSAGQERQAAKAATRFHKPYQRKVYEALLAWRRKDFTVALEGLRPIARTPEASPMVHWYHAVVAGDARQDEEAIAAMDRFERSGQFNPWRGGGSAELLNRRALSQERLGDLSGAKASVARLLRWWRRADADLPLLAEARALHARLSAAPPAARPPTDPTPSIAVLPFADMSEKHDQEYFADGVAEEILSALARVDGLKVIGRTSSFSFKGKAEDLRAIGLKLGVGALLEGSVRREGARIRITAQVVGAADGYHIWSQSYDRQVTSVISLQQEIASSVAEALKVKLVHGGKPLPRSERSIDPEAYSEYLKGRQFHARSSEEAFRRAEKAYQRAVELAPDFAPAWAMLAHMRGVLADFARSPDEVARYQQGSLDAAERSVALAPDLADGFAARGPIRSIISRDWSGARSDLERALRLNSGDGYTHYLHAMFLLAPTGRLREAIGALRRATELDPLRPIAWSSLGTLYNATGQLDLARGAFERSLEISPEHDYGIDGLAVTSLLEGQPGKALDASRRSGSEAGRMLVAAVAEGDLGREREARQALELLASRFADGRAYTIAAAHAWRGDGDQAFAWLDRALAQRDSGLLELGYDPLLRRIRSDPRWKGLLRRVNLPVH